MLVRIFPKSSDKRKDNSEVTLDIHTILIRNLIIRYLYLCLDDCLDDLYLDKIPLIRRINTVVNLELIFILTPRVIIAELENDKSQF